MKHIFEYENYNTLNSPAFSIRDVKVGDFVDIGGRKVKIIEFTSWIKNKEAKCMSFIGELENGEVKNFRYDDGVDGYVIK